MRAYHNDPAVKAKYSTADSADSALSAALSAADLAARSFSAALSAADLAARSFSAAEIEFQRDDLLAILREAS